MSALICDICGGSLEMGAGGDKGVCTSCGVSYSIECMRELYSGIKVSQTGSQEDVQQWKNLLNTYLQSGDFGAAEQTTKKILEAVPGDTFANEIYQKLQSWKYIEVKNGVLTNYTGCEAVLEIPGCVKQIGDGAFGPLFSGELREARYFGKLYNDKDWGNTALVQVILPDGIVSIGENAFYGCSNLAEINLPESLQAIGRRAFVHCKALHKITIPKGVKEIGYHAFERSGLQEVTGENCALLSGSEYEPFYETPWGNAERERRWEEEQQRKADAMQQLRNQGKCQHCGGAFKGFLTKICTQCGKQKDY